MNLELANIYDRILATSARVREIKQARTESLNHEKYVLNQYKKLPTPIQMVETEIEAGIIGKDYLSKAVSATNKRIRDHNKTRRR